METMSLLPLRRKPVRIFIALKNLSSSAGFEPAKLGSNGKYDNHQITEKDLTFF
jgi:hypothetical protein